MYALDLEATGTDPAKDRIIQIGLVNMMGGDTVSYTIDPDRPIPQEVAALTGLDDHAVFGCPKFAKVAYHIATTIHDEVLVTFNGLRFDVPMLAEEFERAGVDYKFGPIIDVGVLFKMHHTRTLADAVRIYLGKEMEGRPRCGQRRQGDGGGSGGHGEEMGEDPSPDRGRSGCPMPLRAPAGRSAWHSGQDRRQSLLHAQARAGRACRG